MHSQNKKGSLKAQSRNTRTPALHKTTQHFAHPDHEPYAYQRGILHKRHFVPTTTYTPDTNTVLTVDLNSNLLSGNGDNLRLGDTVIFTGAEIQGTASWGEFGTSQTDVTCRAVICASIDNTMKNPFVYPSDPLSPIDNTIVPSQCVILWDSKPFMLTCRANSTEAIFHNHHTFHRKRQPFTPSGDAGIWSQYDADNVLETGRIYAMFISDAADAAQYAAMTFSFALEFKDVVKSIQSQVQTSIEELKATQKQIKDEIRALKRSPSVVVKKP